MIATDPTSVSDCCKDAADVARQYCAHHRNIGGDAADQFANAPVAVKPDRKRLEMRVEFAANIDDNLLADIIEIVILNETRQRTEQEYGQQRQRDAVEKRNIGVGENRVDHALDHGGEYQAERRGEKQANRRQQQP